MIGKQLNLNTTVVGLRERPIAEVVPDVGQALIWNGNAWIPAWPDENAITSVNAGLGLMGGGDSGDVTLSLAAPLSIDLGGTGQGTAAAALAALGGAPIDSPEFLGVPLAPTADPGTDTDQLATCAFVEDAIASIEDGGGGAGVIDYSLAEQDTGMKWLDGRKIYQITTQLDPLPSSGGSFVIGSATVANINQFIHVWAVAENPSAGYCFFLPYADGNNPQASIGLWLMFVPPNRVDFYCGNGIYDRSGFSRVYATFHYTCTDR